MNTSVYLFGKFKGNYTQYPDDYTRKLFLDFENNIKSDVETQLMIHRDNDLVYCAYIHLKHSSYVGICFVFNGVVFSDANSFCKLCEDSFTSSAFSDVLDYPNKDEIFFQDKNLYKLSNKIEPLATLMSAKILDEITFVKLPPVNYSNNINEAKTFNLDIGNEVITEAVKEYSNVFVSGNYSSKLLAGYSEKISTLNDENAKLRKKSKGFVIVAVVFVVLAIGYIICDLGKNLWHEHENNEEISTLKEKNGKMEKTISDLETKNRNLIEDYYSVKSELKQQDSIVNCLQNDTIRLAKTNEELLSQLEESNDLNDSYRQRISQKDREISSLKRQLKEAQEIYNSNRSSNNRYNNTNLYRSSWGWGRTY